MEDIVVECGNSDTARLRQARRPKNVSKKLVFVAFVAIVWIGRLQRRYFVGLE